MHTKSFPCDFSREVWSQRTRPVTTPILYTSQKHLHVTSPNLHHGCTCAYSVLVNSQRTDEWINKSERQSQTLCVSDGPQSFTRPESNPAKFINPANAGGKAALAGWSRGRQIARLIHLFKRLLRFIPHDACGRYSAVSSQ